MRCVCWINGVLLCRLGYDVGLMFAARFTVRFTALSDTLTLTLFCLFMKKILTKQRILAVGLGTISTISTISALLVSTSYAQTPTNVPTTSATESSNTLTPTSAQAAMHAAIQAAINAAQARKAAASPAVTQPANLPATTPAPVAVPIISPSVATPTALVNPAPNANTLNNSANLGVKGVGKMSALRGLVSAERIEAQSAQQYQQLLQETSSKRALGMPDDPQVIRLRAIAQKLIPFATRWNERAANWKWEINLIGSKQVNAFCMPGGKIAFYSGILDQLKLTDDEVAMVMGHEIAHALREHGRERAGKAAATQGALSIGSTLLGLGNTGRAMAGAGANLLSLKFGREDETEGDLIGMDLAARAGYDPRAGVALWQKMGAANKGAPPQWLSTHPSGKNRIAEISKHLPEAMPMYANTRNMKYEQLPAYQSNWANIAPIK
jgi:Zn-dependent protease with chaperone function